MSSPDRMEMLAAAIARLVEAMRLMDANQEERDQVLQDHEAQLQEYGARFREHEARIRENNGASAKSSPCSPICSRTSPASTPPPRTTPLITSFLRRQNPAPHLLVIPSAAPLTCHSERSPLLVIPSAAEESLRRRPVVHQRSPREMFRLRST